MERYTEDFLENCKVKPNKNAGFPLPISSSKSTVTRTEDGVIQQHHEGFQHLLLMFSLNQYDELLLLIEQIMLEKEDPILKIPHFEIAMKILTCEVRLRSGHGHEAFNQLIALQNTIEYKQYFIWKWRIDLSIVNAAVRLRLWAFAIEQLIKIHETIHIKIGTYEGEIGAKFIKADIIILCRLARISLQYGSMQSCLYYENVAKELLYRWKLDEEQDIDIHVLNYMRSLSGLIAFSNNKYEEAMIIFKQIMTSKRDTTLPSVMLLFDLNATDIDLFTCISQLEDSMYPSAANDYAVCAMHLGRVQEAIMILEVTIQEDPLSHLIDPIVFNLCTMYDISYSALISEQKKKMLKSVSDIYCVSDSVLNWKSFRLSNS